MSVYRSPGSEPSGAYARQADGHGPGWETGRRSIRGQTILNVLSIDGMTAAAPAIVRPGAGEWRALDGDQGVGFAHAMPRPDRRWFVWLDSWRADAYEALLAAITDDIQQDLYITVDESDYEQLDRCDMLGFVINRREDEYLVPTDAAVTGLGDARLPAGFHAVSARDTEPGALRALDDLLRQDVPGTDGWVNDPAEFQEYTFAPQHFDARTYLVAIDEAAGRHAGLVRVWNEPSRHRLGLIGVVAGYRRRGLALALLATAFQPLHEQGVGEVTAEVDPANTACASLMRRLGARRTGGSVELLRRHGSR
jgi:RimJ/RimL family protein N-acetyltransferase